MNQKHLIFILFLLIFIRCTTNRTVNHNREGKWVYKDTVNGILIKSKGKYKHSLEIKTWKYFTNHKLIKKEKYKNDICYITNYDEKGRIISKGQSKMVDLKDETHWYYFGDWKFFDEKGKLIMIKKYETGVLISEIKL